MMGASVVSVPLFLLVLLGLVLVLLAGVRPEHIVTIEAMVGLFMAYQCTSCSVDSDQMLGLLPGHIFVLYFGCWLRCSTKGVCGCSSPD